MRSVASAMPILVYGLGMASFFFLDIFVSSNMPVEMISAWAETKSYALVGSTLLLLGLDQVLVRYPKAAFQIIKRAAVNGSALSVVILLLLVYSSNVASPYYLGVAVASLALTTMVYSIFRAFNFKLQAQVAVNGWKMVLTAAVLSLWAIDVQLSFPVLTSLSSIFVVVTLVTLNWKKLTTSVSIAHQEPYERAHTRLGAQFLAALLTLSLSIYLEQILLNANGYIAASAQYFAHIAIILPPFVFLNGYLGFILGPFVRNAPQRSTDLYLQHRTIVVCFAFVISIVIAWASGYVFRLLVGVNIEYSWVLASCVASIGFCRFVYTLPSSMVGMLGDKTQIDRLVLVNLAAVCALVSVFYSLVALNVEPALAVGVASLTNWLIRTANGLSVLSKVIRPYV